MGRAVGTCDRNIEEAGLAGLGFRRPSRTLTAVVLQEPLRPRKPKMAAAGTTGVLVNYHSMHRFELPARRQTWRPAQHWYTDPL